MITNVKAKYANGALVPLEPLDLEEGEVVSVSVEKDGLAAKDAPAAKDGQAAKDAPAAKVSPTGKRGIAGVVEMALEAQKSMPPDAWDDLPTDGAKNYKHYLYGWPKEED